MRLPWLIPILLLSLAAFSPLAGCDSAPYTERRQLIVIPENQERAMGARAARDILQTERQSRNPKLVDAVTRAGKRIAAVSGRPDLDWAFHVLENDTVPNAFCLPGGAIFVYTGLFKYVQNEDQLATVMAHEVAHALARHGAERATLEMATQFGAMLLDMFLSEEDPRLGQLASKVWGYGASLGMMLPYSRKQELEADAIGLRLMRQAGYDMNAALAFWENMKKNPQASRVFAFLSTHPTDDKRIERIREEIARLREDQKPS
ncbi:Beta-barrel assembly-enhancing protease [Fundidesulfovibrio magnetotacticus]|uniref:Beta-barrel assembly-enhancing protease n=1 Tax=Fundidesulfovibrio magnetotacticus TaxID=2730080 RepID=A0A6V8M0J6_9BACT|nr:M48 family metallopeptidase [Fundidesulfovibrio magnetotacticus]GFK95536.1 Beta-barrel assembly-enhancing protease [Fundidesulfovibrio magnetotacticus]